MAHSIEDLKRKIRGLLAKAEGTDNEAEQKAFSEKAEALMVKIGVARAELEAEGKAVADDIVEVHKVWTTIYAPVMGRFLYSVGQSYGHLSFLQSRLRKDHVVSYVIGHKSDVEQFLQLVESLHLQVFAALKAFRRENKEIRRFHTIHENFVMDRSFIQAYGYTVAGRLRDMRKTTEAEATPGAALVLVGKQDKVDAWTADRYPSTGKARSSNSQFSGFGAAAGMVAGKSASLGGNSLPGGRVAITGNEG